MHFAQHIYILCVAPSEPQEKNTYFDIFPDKLSMIFNRKNPCETMFMNLFSRSA